MPISRSTGIPARGTRPRAPLSAATVERRRWNHNIHYLPFLLAELPQRREQALDVGCGEGTVARALGPSFAHVSAIDLDEASIEIARSAGGSSGIEYLADDFMTFPFIPASFDLVVCVAALHHMDEEVALLRMAKLLRPGGRLAVLGLARSRLPADLPRELAAIAVNSAHRLTRDQWQSPARTLSPPPGTYDAVRRLSERTLPGAQFRRHLLWRYSILWNQPEPGPDKATPA